MAFNQNVNPTLPKQPRVWPLNLSLTDASNWRQCATGGANGTKVVGASITNSDTSGRIVQMGLGRQAAVTCTSATPAVFTWTGHNLSVGDQIILGGTAVPTGFTAGTTYYVSVTNLVNGSTFSLSTSAANAAAGTNVTSSSTGTAVTAMAIKVVASLLTITLAGTDGATAAQQYMGSTLAPLPADQDAQNYLFLETGDFLMFSSTTTITSAKFVSVIAITADF